MPPSFFDIRVRAVPDAWIPLHQTSGDFLARSDYYSLSLIGRLKPRQTMGAAEAAMTASLRQFLTTSQPAPLDQATRERIASVRIAMADGSRGISVVRQQNTRVLLLLVGAVGVILLIACANVGTLLFARAASREREVAVRRALGASRGRLVRQWLTESALLGVAGAMCGAALAWFVAPRLLATIVPVTTPMTARLDGTVFVFTTGATIVACLLFGLAPSLSAGRVDPIGSLRLSGRGQRRRRTLGLTEPFVVVQIALSLVLVLAATLLTRTLVNLYEHPFGFDQNHVLLVRINPRFGGYQTNTVAPLYEDLRARLGQLPGVERVSFARYAPFSGSRSSSTAAVDGYVPVPGENVSLETILVGPHYPQTIGMPVRAGRAIDADDGPAAPRVAMVNEAFARRFFPDTGPLGRGFSLGSSQQQRYEIVGVLRDAYFREARQPVQPAAFLAMLQEPSGRILDCEFEVRTTGDANVLAGQVRDTIRGVNDRIRIDDVRSLREQVTATFGPERTATGFILAFSLLALVVAAVGLSGVVAHGRARRTNEIGVRMALGAARADVVRLIARETGLRLVLGLVIGFVLARATSHALAAQLFGVTPDDLTSALFAALILSAVVALTTVRPLRRAMRVDPVIALRAD
jgi:predicted permease